MNDIFEQQNRSYNLRSSCNQSRRENVKTVHYGIESVRYLGPKIWELVPNNIKYINSLRKFKKLVVETRGMPLQAVEDIHYPSRVYLTI